MAAENNIVGEVGLIVKPVDPGFDAGVKAIIDRAERQAQINVGANVNTKSADKAIDGLIGKTQEMNKTWQQAALEVGAFTAAVFGVQRAVEGVINKFAGLFDQLAQAKAGFSSILGTERAGGALLDEIREFARVSPFVTQELVNYSQQLLGVGKSAESIVPLLEDVGNIVSSVGGDTQNIGRVLFTLTQIQTIGRLAGQDAMQLQSALIPITKYLADFLGKTTAEVKKLQEAGAISADTVFAAISAAGDKVEGAMANATRNISGARSVLSDSITILLQDQPVLNKMFEDIFKGILKVADFIGSSDFQDAFNRFFESVDGVYESLQPLGAAIGALASEGTITGLNAFATALEVFAIALGAIPPAVLETIVRFFVAMSVVRTPLLLVKYIENINTIQKGLFGLAAAETASTAATQAGTAAVAQQTLALDAQSAAATRATGATRAWTAIQKNIKLAGVGLVAGGMALQDGNNGARDAVGSVATGAGIGTAIAPGVGTVIGGIIGAGLAIKNAQKAADKAAVDAAEQSATAYVTAFNDKIYKEFGESLGDPGALAIYGEELTQNTNITNTYTDRLKDLNTELAAQNTIMGNVRPQSKEYEDAANKARDLVKSIDGVNFVLKKYGEENKTFIETSEISTAVLGPLADKLAALEKLNAGAFTVPSDRYTEEISGINQVLRGETVATTATQILTLTSQMNKFGFTTDFILNTAVDNISKTINVIKGITTEFQQARLAAFDFVKLMKENQTIADEIWSPLIQQADVYINRLKAAESANKTFSSLLGKDGKARDVGEVEFGGVATQILRAAAAEQARLSTDGADAAEALAGANALANGQFQILKETLDVTNSEFIALLQSTGLYTTYLQLQKDAVGILSLTFADLATRFPDLDAILTKLTGLKKGDQNSQTIIPASTIPLLEELSRLEREINVEGEITTANFARRAELIAEITDSTSSLTISTEDAVEAVKKLRTSYEDLDDVWQNTIATANGMSDTLGSLFIVNKDNEIQVTSNLRTFTDVASTILDNSAAVYDRALSTGLDRFKSAEIQAGATWVQFEQLQSALNITDEAFLTLLDSLGLTETYLAAVSDSGGGMVGTLAEISEQTGLTYDEIAELVGIIGEIDPSVKIVITADTVEAIAKLKEIDERINTMITASGGLVTPSKSLQAERDRLLAQVESGGGAGVVDPNTQAQEDARQAEIERKQAEADRLAKAAADKAQREAEAAMEKAIREAEQAAEKAKREAEQAAAEAIRKAEAWANAVEQATEGLTDRIATAADAIADAAGRWVTSIKERTDFESAVSVSRLTRNATSQAGQATELLSGMNDLRARGVTDEVLEALGVDSIADLKQVRKLVRASDADLAGLTSAVSERGAAALALSISEEDRRTRANIVEAIVEAAERLEMDFTKDQAAGVAAQFNITPGVSAEEIALQIIGQLTAGRVG